MSRISRKKIRKRQRTRNAQARAEIMRKWKLLTGRSDQTEQSSEWTYEMRAKKIKIPQDATKAIVHADGKEVLVAGFMH